MQRFDQSAKEPSSAWCTLQAQFLLPHILRGHSLAAGLLRFDIVPLEHPGLQEWCSYSENSPR